MPMIIGEVRRYLRDNNTIRVSRSVRDLAYRSLSVREQLSRTRCCEPTPEEIAAELTRADHEAGGSAVFKAGDVTDALEAIIEPISLFEPVYCDASGDSVFVMDQISDNGVSDDGWLDGIAISEAMKKLSERERSIIALRFYRGKTQMEIADEIGISHTEMPRGDIKAPVVFENTYDITRPMSGHRGVYSFRIRAVCSLSV